MVLQKCGGSDMNADVKLTKREAEFTELVAWGQQKRYCQPLFRFRAYRGKYFSKYLPKNGCNESQ
ncbi:MAG: hypothetical protein LIO65_07100 [Odoribacter sp.]|nr:hypothetical protein [Odoribacter sp.]